MGGCSRRLVLCIRLVSADLSLGGASASSFTSGTCWFVPRHSGRCDCPGPACSLLPRLPTSPAQALRHPHVICFLGVMLKENKGVVLTEYAEGAGLRACAREP